MGLASVLGVSFTIVHCILGVDRVLRREARKVKKSSKSSAAEKLVLGHVEAYEKVSINSLREQASTAAIRYLSLYRSQFGFEAVITDIL